jgi:hypothetical protein
MSWTSIARGLRTVLGLGAGALGAHLDPAWRMEGRAMIRRREKGPATAATGLAGHDGARRARGYRGLAGQAKGPPGR